MFSIFIFSYYSLNLCYLLLLYFSVFSRLYLAHLMGFMCLQFKFLYAFLQFSNYFSHVSNLQWVHMTIHPIPWATKSLYVPVLNTFDYYHIVQIIKFSYQHSILRTWAVIHWYRIYELSLHWEEGLNVIFLP